MFCRNVSFFICILVAVVTATDSNDSHWTTESSPEVTVHSLTSENPLDSLATPAGQQSSDRGWSPASPSPATAVRNTTSPDYAAVCPLWSISAEEKDRRLIEGAKEGSVEEVRTLLAAGADVGAKDADRMTALHWAAHYGHVEAARCLVAAGADVNAGDNMQWTPLHQAAVYNHAAVVRLLAAASADLNAKERDGWTPLHLAAGNGHEEAATALLEAGADRGVRNADGDTPLDAARKNSEPGLVDLLARG